MDGGTANVVCENPTLKRKLPMVNEEHASKVGKMELSNSVIGMFFGRDPNYPETLNKLINPLRCEICNVHMNSMSTSKSHYESRVHDRGLTAWIKSTYTDKNLPAPTIKRFYEKSNANSEKLQCEICELKFTSKIHAQQHYDGRKHGQAMMKLAKANADNRFGIGEAFKQQTTAIEKIDAPPPTVKDEGIQCNLCNIFVTSASELEKHETGSKHYRKLQALKVVKNPLPQTKEAADEIDPSMYRTPSGGFYCKLCNLSIQHENILKEHLKGKKHLKRTLAEKKTT